MASIGVSPAWGAESACEHRPRVRVQVEATSKSRLARRTLDLVTAELTARRSPCEASADAREHAQIVVRWLDSSRVRIEVELRLPDRERRAERDVDHAKIPADGVPAALAIAADELLRAVYEEIESADPTRPKAPPPPAPPQPPLPAPAPTPPVPPHRLGFVLAAEAFPTERALLGPDAELGLALSPHLSLDFHLGLRALAPALEPTSGQPLSSLWIAGVNARHRLFEPLSTLRVDAIAGADALIAPGRSHRAVRPLLRAGLRASYSPAPRLYLQSGLDAALLPIGVGAEGESFGPAWGASPRLGFLIDF